MVASAVHAEFSGGAVEMPNVREGILAMLHRHGTLTLDEVAARMPTVSWSQIFLAVDGLSRAGMIWMAKNLRREYCVALNGPRTERDTMCEASAAARGSVA